MEHVLSDESARALCQNLKAPDKCPMMATDPACDFEFSSCDECRQCKDDSLPAPARQRPAHVRLKERTEARIAFIRGENQVLRRLLDMGLTPGTKVKVTRTAPFNGPVEISVRGSRLALGEEIAANVFVEAEGV